MGDNTIHAGTLVKCIWDPRRSDFIYLFLTNRYEGKATDMDDDWRSYEVMSQDEGTRV